MKQPWNRGDLFDRSTSTQVAKASSDVVQSSLSRTLAIDAGAQVQQVLVTVRARPPSGPIAATLLLCARGAFYASGANDTGSLRIGIVVTDSG